MSEDELYISEILEYTDPSHLCHKTSYRTEVAWSFFVQSGGDTNLQFTHGMSSPLGESTTAVKADCTSVSGHIDKSSFFLLTIIRFPDTTT